MKYVSHTAVLFIISLLLAAAAHARSDLQILQQTSPQLRASIQTRFMTRRLHLTPQQQRRVAALNLNYAQRMDPILKGNMGELRKAIQLRRIQRQKDAALRRVFTYPQYQTYMASKAALRKKLLAGLRSRQSRLVR